MFFVKRKKAFQSILDYVEGRISINQFKEVFETDPDLPKLLKQKLDSQYRYLEPYQFNLYTFFQKEYGYRQNWDTVRTRYGLMAELSRFLDIYNIPFLAYSKYEEDHMFCLKIQPSWLDIIDDQGIFDKILQERPTELSQTKQIAWGKARIKELFRYDKTYPRWVQEAEWPIVNGKPLVFSHQSKEKKDDERVYFYFYDPETMKQTVVEQFY